jgi:hypothetical protein
MPFCGGAKERSERLRVDSIRDEHPPRQRILHELSPRTEFLARALIFHGASSGSGDGSHSWVSGLGAASSQSRRVADDAAYHMPPSA